jgi:hypothetical protein
MTNPLSCIIQRKGFCVEKNIDLILINRNCYKFGKRQCTGQYLIVTAIEINPFQSHSILHIENVTFVAHLTTGYVSFHHHLTSTFKTSPLAVNN